MRLLHTSTLNLHSFFGDSIPPYAILSHTWEEEEVTLQDIQGSEAQKLKGYKKLKGSCETALADGFEYVWIDTCCIDKSSSSELQEAINSMFDWYALSDACYVYLPDVHGISKNYEPGSTFESSRWFTRGWTLQELIAPQTMIFYNSSWQEIGTKSSLKRRIAAITGIPQEILSGMPFEGYSVAQRMSWASRRATTRLEDEAYCLMGIFKIHMPMLYGEGRRAFIRLQEEILKNENDHTLFAWRLEKSKEPEQFSLGHSVSSSEGILATSPSAFRNSASMITFNLRTKTKFEHSREPCSLTGRGLAIELPIKRVVRADPSTHIAVLDCCDESYYPKEVVTCLKLIEWGSSKRENETFTRHEPAELLHIDLDEIQDFKVRKIYAKKANIPPPGRPPPSQKSLSRLALNISRTGNSCISMVGRWPMKPFESREAWYIFEASTWELITLSFESGGTRFLVKMGWAYKTLVGDMMSLEGSDPRLTLAQQSQEFNMDAILVDTSHLRDRVSLPLRDGRSVVLAIKSQIFEGERTQAAFLRITGETQHNGAASD